MNEQLAMAVERLCGEGVAQLCEALAVAERLKGPLHVHAVFEALGCVACIGGWTA